MAKIRKHRKKEWWFYPPEGSKISKGRCYVFKYKSDLMKFLNKHARHCINGEVILHESSFAGSYTIRGWFVWYNEYKYWHANQKFKIVLKQEDFRGRKYYGGKVHKVSKPAKKYFAFSDKVISLMCRIGDEGVDKRKAEKLIKLFEKRGFKDFEPSESDWAYINGHIEDGIGFFHWSDRCGALRMKVVLEYLNLH